MDEVGSLKVVQGIYAAFGQGNIPAVLSRLSEDVEWWVAGSSDIPYAGMRRGRRAVEEWFTVLVKSAEIQAFEPKEFITQGDSVVVIGHERLKTKPVGRVLGRVVSHEWVQVFTVRDGQVSRFREFLDTAALASAFRTIPSGA